MANFYITILIADTGITPVEGPFDLYTDKDNYTDKLIEGISKDDLINTESPYVVSVPTGTQKIRLVDTKTDCIAEVEIDEVSLCVTCDLAFTNYSVDTVSRIEAGNLIGSCDNEITAYRIFWYGPGQDSTNIAYKSGFGNSSIVGDYDHTHPLTGTSRIFAQQGLYRPVINKIVINDVLFEETNGELVSQSDGSICYENLETQTVEVRPLTCDNGNDEDPDYSHFIDFRGISSGTPPTKLEATFELDVNTNYLAFSFQGYTVPDTIKLTFQRINSSESYVLEWWTIGMDNVGNQVNTLPFRRNINGPMKKVLDLSNLNVQQGDAILIEVEPNETNPSTDWTLKLQCLEEFDCSLCTDNSDHYRIIGDSIRTTRTNDSEGNTCNLQVLFHVTACDNVNNFNNSHLAKYTETTDPALPFLYGVFNNPQGFLLLSTEFLTWFGQPRLGAFQPVVASGGTCSSSSDKKIKFEKSTPDGTGLIRLEFDAQEDYNYYLNRHIAAMTILAWDDDLTPQDAKYYSSLFLIIPDTSNTPDAPCGDGTPGVIYRIHASHEMTHGGENGLWYMELTMPKIDYDFPVPACTFNPPLFNNVTAAINNSSNSENRTIITNKGSRYFSPFIASLSRLTEGDSFIASNMRGWIQANAFLNETTVFNGNDGETNLESTLCDFESKGYQLRDTSGNPIFNYYENYKYYYRVELLNENYDFRILASPIINGVYDGWPSSVNQSTLIEVYRFEDGNVTSFDPDYVMM